MLNQIVPTDPTVLRTHRLASGNPAQEIVRIAEEEAVEMIVMSTHGRTGLAHVLMGSVAEQVVRRAACPVLTLGQSAPGPLKAKCPETESDSQGKTVLFATDFSASSNAALQHASSLASQLGARLLILHVEQPLAPYGGGEVYSSYVLDYHSESLKKELDNVRPCHSQVPYIHQMVIGDPANEIIRVAKEVKASMIVISTHGRTGLAHLLMGSVAEGVIRGASCPVVTFKQSQTQSRSQSVAKA